MRITFLFVGVCAVALAIAACGGSDDPATGSSTAAPSATGPSTYDVKFSGALTAEWKSGTNDGSGITCSVVEDGRLVLGLYGKIGDATYGFSLLQAYLTNGTFPYPAAPVASGLASTTPELDLSTNSDPSAHWIAQSQGEKGGGSVIVEFGHSGPVTIMFNVDLKADAKPDVHVGGRVDCDVG